MAASTIEFGAIITGLGGGLALFLFGMRQMTESLQTVAGNSTIREKVYWAFERALDALRDGNQDAAH